MTADLLRARQRFLGTLAIVHREGRVLRFSTERLRAYPMTGEWVKSLNEDMATAEILEAFVSRFGRMQDTIGDKLIPRALAAQAERQGSALDNLARAEQLGWMASAAEWLTARELRNRLVHEYTEDPDALAADIQSAIEFVPMLMQTYGNMRRVALEALGVAEAALPPLF
jgi:hypothetical protein